MMINNSVDSGNPYRTQALIAMVVAVLVGVAGWVGLSNAAQRGVERLAAIDRARIGCAALWSAAHGQAETLLVDARALTDTIDPQSTQALTRCGNLRTQGDVR